MSRSPSSFDSTASAWIETQRSVDRSPNTLYTYLCALANLRQFLARRQIRNVRLVTFNHLSAWQAHLWKTGCKVATLQMFTLIVRRWFAWQVSTGRLFQSPARTLQPPRVTRPIVRCPCEKDMLRLLRSIKGRGRFALRDRAILETAYATGARLAELAALDLASLDLNGRCVRLYGKGQRERMVPLTRIAVRTLRAYLHRARPRFVQTALGQTALFVGSRGGQRMMTAAFTAVIRKHAKKVGLILTMHDIRRAFATHLLAGGAHPAVVRELLGHRDYTHLHHYLKLHPESAINALRNSRIFQ
ncbi:MAG: tyrosine-type recombinase/integrase [Opitutaceae bacterium]